MKTERTWCFCDVLQCSYKSLVDSTAAALSLHKEVEMQKAKIFQFHVDQARPMQVYFNETLALRLLSFVA